MLSSLGTKLLRHKGLQESTVFFRLAHFPWNWAWQKVRYYKDYIRGILEISNQLYIFAYFNVEVIRGRTMLIKSLTNVNACEQPVNTLTEIEKQLVYWGNEKHEFHYKILTWIISVITSKLGSFYRNMKTTMHSKHLVCY